MSRVAALLLLAAWPAGATTLRAGPGTDYPQPSAAIAAAAPGDTVAIAPGTYYDCAAWSTDRLTIDGRGDGGDAVFSDRSCQDKAAFVIGGAGTVLRGIAFTRQRVPDRNGAGIRLEGGSLTVEDCSFDDEEAALIAAPRPGAELVLRRVTVRHAGAPGSTLAAITAGGAASLHIEDSSFSDPRGDGGAVRTDVPAAIAGTSFSYGAGSVPVVEAGGMLDVQSSAFHLAGSRPAAIRALGPGVTVRGTTLDGVDGALLLQDWSDGTPVLAGNRVGPGDTEASSAGYLVHRGKDTAHATIDSLRHLAGRMRDLLRTALR